MAENVRLQIEYKGGKVQLEHALQSKWYGTQWSCVNADYSKLEWAEGNTIAKPSKSEIDAEIVKLQAEWDAQDYARDRAKAYPSIEDVTVALAEKAEGNSDMWDEITSQRQAVKDANPKPTGSA